MNKKILLLIVVIFAVFIGFAFLLRTTIFAPSNMRLQELKSIADQNPLVKNYAGITPTYSLYPNDPTKNIYIVDYYNNNTKSGISVWVDLNEKKVLKTQVLVGVGT
jgi:lipopolysaccharide export LptBFGC system permease protein LptF